MKRMLRALCFLSIAVAVCGCHSSSKIVSSHFSEMVEIAKAYPNDCDGMGNALIKYLEDNGDELKEAMKDTGNASSDEAKEVFRTSLELHEVTHGCMNPSAEAFRARLADLTLTTAAAPADRN